VLIYFVRGAELAASTIFILFGAFIFFCGTPHEAIIFWWPAYRLAAVIKLGTAQAEGATVMALVPIMPWPSLPAEELNGSWRRARSGER
jgi:hypothetical protein